MRARFRRRDIEGIPENDGVSGRLTVLEQPVLIVVETQVVLVLVEED
ncbi:hypothetical protein [uncultured Sphingomonas sp.]|nr:hypothetical protein [uncultured Sphingomonas sp.]